MRTGTSSSKILGTSISCSGSGVIVSKKCRMPSNCSTICGTGASRVCTMGAKRTKSTMCWPLLCNLLNRDACGGCVLVWLCGCGVVGLWWLWCGRCADDMSLSKKPSRHVHRIRVPGHQGKLPATPAPGTHVQLDGV